MKNLNVNNITVFNEKQQRFIMAAHKELGDTCTRKELRDYSILRQGLNWAPSYIVKNDHLKVEGKRGLYLLPIDKCDGKYPEKASKPAAEPKPAKTSKAAAKVAKVVTDAKAKKASKAASKKVETPKVAKPAKVAKPKVTVESKKKVTKASKKAATPDVVPAAEPAVEVMAEGTAPIEEVVQTTEAAE